MVVFASHPSPLHLRTTPAPSKPTPIRALTTFYQIDNSLRKRKSGLIPPGLEILFRFVNRKPDIVGYMETNLGNTIFTAEVKRDSLTIWNIYQAKMYKELFGATFGFLISTEPIPEELKRLLRNIPIILMSAGDYTFHFLALARFDLEKGTFTDWFANQSQDTDPFTHLKSLS